MGVEPSLSIDGILRAVTRGLITVEDAVDIIGGDDPLPVIRAAKLQEISDTCNKVIVAGVDLELAGETVHFKLKTEDQSNIANLFRVVELGGTEFPYQADGGICRIYTADEIVKIYIAMQELITRHTTYHNTLKAYVQSLTTPEEIATIVYGMKLPEPYFTEMDRRLAVAKAQMETIISKVLSQKEADTNGRTKRQYARQMGKRSC